MQKSCTTCRTNDHWTAECPKREWNRAPANPLVIDNRLTPKVFEGAIAAVKAMATAPVFPKGGRPRIDEPEPIDPKARRKWKERQRLRKLRSVAPDPDKV